MPKVKKVPMPEISPKRDWKSVVKVVGFSLLIILTLSAIGAIVTKLKTEYVQKGVINQYACQIVDVDQESGFFAVKCLTK